MASSAEQFASSFNFGALNKATELDPDYAAAQAYSAWCYEQRLTREWSRGH